MKSSLRFIQGATSPLFASPLKRPDWTPTLGQEIKKLPNRLASQPTNKKAMRTLRKKRVSTCKKRLVSCALHRVARNVQLTGEILAQRDARFASLSCQFSSLSSESSLPCSWLDAAWRRERSLRLRSSAVRARQPCTVRV